MSAVPDGGSFLGRGWAFPPSFDPDARGVQMVSDEEDIRQSLEILLSTTVGERVMQPQYGCDLQAYQFQPVNNTFLGFVADLVERAILYYEPRIVVQDVTVTRPDSEELLQGKVVISVDYVIATTNSRLNFVYDFYLRELDGSV